LPGRFTFDQTVNRVCKPCNEGWLNDLEKQVEDTLVSAIKGVKTELTHEMSMAVATWAAKTAAVRSLQDKEPQGIPNEHFRYIYEHRACPPNTAVWMAHIGYCRATSHRHVRRLSQLDGTNQTAAQHFTSLLIGHLGLYVSGSQAPLGLVHSLEQAQDELLQRAYMIWPEYIPIDWPIPVIPLRRAKRLGGVRGDTVHADEIHRAAMRGHRVAKP
jgi:hypothetical protein